MIQSSPAEQNVPARFRLNSFLDFGLLKNMRLRFLKLVVVFFCSGAMVAFSQNADGIIAPARAGKIAVPAARQLKWHEAEIGVVFHYDLHVFDGKRYSQTANRITPITDPDVFNPKKLDCEQWILAAKAAGAKFAVITATHETGFGIYQSEANPFCLKASKWRNGKGDVIAEFVAACRKHGIAPGIYIGIRWNAHLNVFDFKARGKDAEKRQADYRKMCEAMTRELCTKYGELFMIWYDGGASDPKLGAPNVLPIVAKLQPNCLFYHNAQRADFRWGLSESGTVPYPNWSSYPTPSTSFKRTEEQRRHGDPNGRYWVPAMADTPLRGANGRHEWFWEPGDENAVYPLSKLMEMYEKSVGRNATLILGLTPDPDGLMPVGDVARLKEFGAAVKKTWGTPKKSTKGESKELTIRFARPEKLSAAIIQEEIRAGHKIRAYTLEVQEKNSQWKEVATGTSVGHKRIEKFDPLEALAIRLRVSESAGTPDIINFAAY